MQKAEPEADRLAGQETVYNWFEAKLLDERLKLERSHKDTLEELKVKLGPTSLRWDDVRDLPCIIPGKVRITPAVANADVAATVDSVVNVSEKKAQDQLQSEGAASLGVIESKASAAFGYETEKSGASHDFFQSIVLSKKFECFYGTLILFNMLVMAIEAQYIGLGIGHDIKYPRYNESNTEVWAGVGDALVGLDYFFGIMYTIELLCKVLGLRLSFIDAWNVLDVTIVALWYVDLLASNIELPINTMLLRLLRLAKLIRLLKLARALSGFEQLFLMITAVKGSLGMFGWATLLLVMSLVSFALFLNQVLVSYVIENPDVSSDVKHTCFEYFGTFARSVFSMFELTLGNWVQISRFLSEDVNEFFILFTISYKLTFGFSIIAVINACFIKETFRLAEHDDLLMILEADSETKVHNEKMLELLNLADSTGDGSLTKDEFTTVCKIPEVDYWLAAQGLNVTDTGDVFDMIDDGSGKVSKEELVEGVNRVKGAARSLDLAYLRKQFSKREMDIQEILARVEGMERKLLNEVTSIPNAMRSLAQQPANASREEFTMDLNAKLSQLAGDIAVIKDSWRKYPTMAMPTTKQATPIQVCEPSCESNLLRRCNPY